MYHRRGERPVTERTRTRTPGGQRLGRLPALTRRLPPASLRIPLPEFSMRVAAFLALSLVALVPASAQQPAASAPHSDVSPEDRLIHDQMLVMDTHLDVPSRFRTGWDLGELHHFAEDNSQVDLPRMEQGGLDGGFFVIYTAQGELTPAGYRQARDAALLRAQEIHRMLGAHRDRIALVTTADEGEAAWRAGKRLAYISIENSWPLGDDLSLLQTFYNLGVRMAGPVHSRDNQLADSTTGQGRWRGLSPLGRRWVAEMNRLGMLVDVSHSSDAAFDQMVALSRVPVIASHSGPSAINEHPRNLDDDRMRRLARSGGVMFLNSLFLAPHDTSEERSRLEERQLRWGQLNAQERRQLLTDRAALEARQPFQQADFDLYMRALLHSVRVMGVDHVGLGADWDGGGGVRGMEDVSLLPRITARLRREGMAEADIAKIMGGNLMRVLRQAEAGRQPR
jgi:membrane dipeptidase